MSECPWKYLHFVVEPDIYSDIYLCRKEPLPRNSLHVVAFFEFLEQIAQIVIFFCRWNKCPNALYLYYILWYQYVFLEQKLLDAFCSKKKGFFPNFWIFWKFQKKNTKIIFKNAFFSEFFEKPQKMEKNLFFWNRKHPIISVPKPHIGIIKCSINICHSDIYFIYIKKSISVLSVPKIQKMLQNGGSLLEFIFPT